MLSGKVCEKKYVGSYPAQNEEHFFLKFDTFIIYYSVWCLNNVLYYSLFVKYGCKHRKNWQVKTGSPYDFEKVKWEKEGVKRRFF